MNSSGADDAVVISWGSAQDSETLAMRTSNEAQTAYCTIVMIDYVLKYASVFFLI